MAKLKAYRAEWVNDSFSPQEFLAKNINDAETKAHQIVQDFHEAIRVPGTGTYTTGSGAINIFPLTRDILTTAIEGKSSGGPELGHDILIFYGKQKIAKLHIRKEFKNKTFNLYDIPKTEFEMVLIIENIFLEKFSKLHETNYVTNIHERIWVMDIVDKVIAAIGAEIEAKGGL